MTTPSPQFIPMCREKHPQNAIQMPENMDYLTMVLNGFTEPFFILDSENRIQTLNNAALQYSKNKYKKVVGSTCSSICGQTPNSCDGCPVINAAQLSEKENFTRCGARDTSLTELVSASPLFDTKQKSKGTIVSIKDITEKQQINEQLILANRLSSLNQLSSGITHEIRNPLAAIILFTDIMADTERFNRTEQELEILTGIEKGCKTIGNVVSRVLDFAKPVAYSRQALSINRLIKDSVQFCSSKMNKVNVTVELTLDDTLPNIEGEGIELEQVLYNLIINAIDAMPDGGKLFLETSLEESSFYTERQILKVAIGDTGTGITTEIEDTIFEPFFSTKPMGAGMGLTISHRIISHHGGTLYRDSKRNDRTEFVFELPLIGQ